MPGKEKKGSDIDAVGIYQSGMGPEDMPEQALRNVALHAAVTGFIFEELMTNLDESTGLFKEGIDWEGNLQKYNEKQIEANVNLDNKPISWQDITLADVISSLRRTRFPEEARIRDAKIADDLDRYLQTKAGAI